MGFLATFVNEWTILIFAVLYALYKYSVANYEFFKKKNIPNPKPLPFFGSSLPMISQRMAFYDFLLNICEKFKDNKVFGFYETRNPLTVLNDPELVKQVTVKDFDHFPNHRSFITVDDDPLFGNSLFILKDQKWRDMRATLSPAFTGSKMRLMFELLNEVGKTAIDHLKGEAEKASPFDINLKDFFTRYTNDVIASAAFGLKVNSLQEKDNEFYLMGRKATNFSGLTSLKFFLFSSFGFIMRLFKIRLFDKKFADYFNHLVLDTMKHRAENGIVRPDMINLLMEARKGALKYEENGTKDSAGFATVEESQVGLKTHNRNWTDQEIVANCFIFFLAGFDTVSVLMCFCAHELMENPDIQKRLIDEIDEVRESLNGKPVTYEVVQKMKYLDMVVSETMRKWPPVIANDRVCVKPYTIHDDSTGNTIRFNVGDVIWVPVLGFHHNPEYFPNPKKFDPERFSDENKDNIKPFTYLPFGVGPRNCIGSRFALMECKTIIFHLLSNFTFEAAEKTMKPIELSPSGFQLQPKTGFWLRLKPRTKA